MIQPYLWELIIDAERKRHFTHAKGHPNGTPATNIWPLLGQVRELIAIKPEGQQEVTWAEYLFEDTLQVLIEVDQNKLQADLVQVAATALKWASQLKP